MQKHKLTRLSLALLTAFSLNTESIAADVTLEPEKVTIYDTDGSELVHFLVLPEGQKDSDDFVSTGIYPKEFDSALRRVFSFNRNLVGSQKGETPTISFVPYRDTEDIGNAFAGSEGKGYLGFTDFSAVYIGTGIPESEKATTVAKIGINVLGTS